MGLRRGKTRRNKLGRLWNGKFSKIFNKNVTMSCIHTLCFRCMNKYLSNKHNCQIGYDYQLNHPELVAELPPGECAPETLLDVLDFYVNNLTSMTEEIFIHMTGCTPPCKTITYSLDAPVTYYRNTTGNATLVICKTKYKTTFLKSIPGANFARPKRQQFRIECV